MPKSSNQKRKLLAIRELLLERTDEAHPITMAELLAALETRGICAERKSVYDDLELLREFGTDVIKAGRGYYIGQRQFELPELKLLVDVVQSSKFITEKKTRSLIRKLSELASIHEAQLLQRQMYVCSRVKSMNEHVYYLVDEISSAIFRDSAIRFRYFNYNEKKEREYRHDGAWYEVSPFVLMWDDENYYLLAWNEQVHEFRHYRVDKMDAVTQTQTPRLGKEAFAQMDLSTYSQQVFGMFTGDETIVRLRFENALAGAVLDRFGQEVILVPDGQEHFIVTVQVRISPQFFAWMFGFGAQAELLSPESARQKLAAQAEAVYKCYSDASSASAKPDCEKIFNIQK